MSESKKDTDANSSAPRRDKFAAMASRSTSSSNEEEDPSTATTAAIPIKKEGDPSVAAGQAVAITSPKRDKLSALAARQSGASTSPSPGGGGRGNSKLAAMSASQGSSSAAPETTTGGPTTDAERAAKEQERLAAIEKRLGQRQEILDNLDRAEKMTCRLLEIAHQTTTALQDLNNVSSSTSTTENLSNLSKAYRETLQELHPLLTTNTDKLIRSYQNHSFESDRSMYAARVEMRLAQERTDLLRTFRDFEAQERAADDGAGAGVATTGVTVKNENNKRRRGE